MKNFTVKVFFRQTPDDGKLADPSQYQLAATEIAEAWHPKTCAEIAATEFNARAGETQRHIQVGDLMVVAGIAYEFRMMGWEERTDSDFIAGLGIQGHGLAARWARKLAKWKVQWARSGD